ESRRHFVSGCRGGRAAKKESWMPARPVNPLGWSDVTPRETWLNRRALLAGAGAGVATAVARPLVARADAGRYSTSASPNTLEEITNYNNFYEFGWNKDDPAAYAGALTTDP